MQEGPTLRDFLTLLGLSLIWGSSYVLIKWGLEVFTARQIGVLRLGISALALAPLAVTHLRRVRWRQVPLLILVGLTGTALPAFLFPTAQQYLSSSLTGMLSSLTPLCTFLVAWLAFRNRPVRQQVIGIALGLGGALALAYISPSGKGDSTQQLGYATLVLLACVCYGTAANLVANYLREVPALTITVVSYFLVGLPALGYAIGGAGVVPTLLRAGYAGAAALAYVTILALGSTVLAGLVYYRLIQRAGAVFASTVSYLIPVVALLWGLADNEGFVWQQLPAIALVLVGVFLSKRK